MVSFEIPLHARAFSQSKSGGPSNNCHKVSVATYVHVASSKRQGLEPRSLNWQKSNFRKTLKKRYFFETWRREGGRQERRARVPFLGIFYIHFFLAQKVFSCCVKCDGCGATRRAGSVAWSMACRGVLRCGLVWCGFVSFRFVASFVAWFI